MSSFPRSAHFQCRHTRSCKANYDLYIWTSRQVLKLHVFLDMCYTTHPNPSLWGVKVSLPACLSLYIILLHQNGGWWLWKTKTALHSTLHLGRCRGVLPSRPRSWSTPFLKPTESFFYFCEFATSSNRDRKQIV